MLHISAKSPMISYELYHFSGQQNPHHHTCRFLCLLDGTIDISIKAKQLLLSTEDILYLPAETKYQIQSKQPVLVLYVCFHPYFLLHVLGFHYQQIKSFYTDDLANIKNSLQTHIANLVIACLGKDEVSPCGIYAKAYELLHYVSLHCLEAGAVSPENKTDAKLKRLGQYLGSHYTESISLAECAKALEFTPPYLSNFIKKHIGLTFGEYLNTYRLKGAGLLLRYTSESMTKIASLCGFPNPASFLKSYQKAAGISAEAYQASFVDASDDPLPGGLPVTNTALIMDYIFNYMPYTASAAALYQETILQKESINVLHRTPLKPNWNVLINLGTAQDFERPTFRHHLSLMQQELHFKYGRCTEVFTLARIYTIEQKKTYDFSRIFRLIDFMRSIHLRPFFDIDNKPFRLYKEMENNPAEYHIFLSIEQYDAYLFEILPEFIKACIIRYGFDEFSTWKFELWRRYNVNMTSLEPPFVYCQRFQRVAQILKSLVPGAVLGGPGFNGFLDTDKFSQLLSAFYGAEYQPDFISAYYFPYLAQTPNDDHVPAGYTADKNPNNMITKITEWQTMQNRLGFGSLPLYITEYSAYLSSGNYINDSTYPAVYIFQQCIQNYGKVDGLGYWLATDVSLDYGNPSAPLFGGNGLLSKDGIRKPSYYAHDFLNRMGDQLIGRGEHYLITASADGNLQILVYYFSFLRESFTGSISSQELLHYPYSAFGDVLPLEFHMELNHIPAGSYSIKETTLDLSHGNVLSTWGHLNHIKNIGSEDIWYLMNQSIPAVQIHVEEITGSYLLHTRLNHNVARLFTLHLHY